MIVWLPQKSHFPQKLKFGTSEFKSYFPIQAVIFTRSKKRCKHLAWYFIYIFKIYMFLLIVIITIILMLIWWKWIYFQVAWRGKLIWKLVSSPGEAANGSRNKAFLQGQERTNHFQDDWFKHFGLAKYVVTSRLYDVSQISTNRIQYP